MPENQPYDVDNPPESSRDHIGKLVVTAYINSAEEAAVIGDFARDSYTQYADKVGQANVAVWMLVSEALNVQRDDGTPAMFSDIIKLTGKDGRWLGKGQTPDKVAQQFLSLGVTASPTKLGQENHALGRVFKFQDNTIKLGRTFEKRVNLWPTELFVETPVIPAGEMRTIAAASSDGAVPGAVPSASPLSGEQTVTILVETLTGVTPADMLAAVLKRPELKSVGSVIGVNLLEAATDESLATLLTEHGLMTLADGVLQPIA